MYHGEGWLGTNGAGLARRSDRPVGQFDQPRAATAHLDGHIPQRRAMKSNTRPLLVVRTTDIRQLSQCSVFELLNGVDGSREHKTILALNCFGILVP